MKIDILDDYIRTPEWFRGLSNIYRSTRGLPEPPGGYWASWALVAKREGRPRGGTPPPCPSPNWTRGGGGAPLLPSLLLLLPPSPYGNRKGRGANPTWSRTLPLGRATLGRPPPPSLLYIWGRGHPIDTQFDLLAVCSAPPPQFTPSVIAS